MQVWRIRKRVLIALVVVAVLIPLCLWLFQERMIYLPRPYDGEVPSVDTPTLRQLHFATSQGDQLAFYVPPRSGQVPTTIWLICAGNADRALTWHNFATELSETGVGSLLIDYPGYGECAGKPTPDTILENTTAAVAALGGYLQVSDIQGRMAGYGHSLGAAAVFQYATAHGAQRVVAVAPFTSMLAMARRKVGWPLCQLLQHRFDNLAAATVCAQRSIPVLVVHGGADSIIPVAMGRAIAVAAHGYIIEVPSAGHISITGEAEADVLAFMAGDHQGLKLAVATAQARTVASPSGTSFAVGE